nr:uncharacterized protein LOC111770296 [Equus caballus]
MEDVGEEKMIAPPHPTQQPPPREGLERELAAEQASVTAEAAGAGAPSRAWASAATQRLNGAAQAAEQVLPQPGGGAPLPGDSPWYQPRLYRRPISQGLLSEDRGRTTRLPFLSQNCHLIQQDSISQQQATSRSRVPPCLRLDGHTPCPMFKSQGRTLSRSVRVTLSPWANRLSKAEAPEAQRAQAEWQVPAIGHWACLPYITMLYRGPLSHQNGAGRGHTG